MRLTICRNTRWMLATVALGGALALATVASKIGRAHV